MKITDYLTEERIAEFKPEALQSFQNVLDSNLEPKFAESLAVTVEKLMLKTGSTVLMPGHNSPPLCRMGIELLKEHRNVQDIYFPLCKCIFCDDGTVADPVSFCMIAHDPVGMLYEWEWFFDRWRRGELIMNDITRDDMDSIDGQLRRQLIVIRKNRAKEAKAEEKRKKKEAKNV
jgi:hypothetical protein